MKRMPTTCTYWNRARIFPKKSPRSCGVLMVSMATPQAVTVKMVQAAMVISNRRAKRGSESQSNGISTSTSKTTKRSDELIAKERRVPSRSTTPSSGMRRISAAGCAARSSAMMVAEKPSTSFAKRIMIPPTVTCWTTMRKRFALLAARWARARSLAVREIVSPVMRSVCRLAQTVAFKPATVDLEQGAMLRNPALPPDQERTEHLDGSLEDDGILEVEPGHDVGHTETFFL